MNLDKKTALLSLILLSSTLSMHGICSDIIKTFRDFARYATKDPDILFNINILQRWTEEKKKKLPLLKKEKKAEVRGYYWLRRIRERYPSVQEYYEMSNHEYITGSLGLENDEHFQEILDLADKIIKVNFTKVTPNYKAIDSPILTAALHLLSTSDGIKYIAKNWRKDRKNLDTLEKFDNSLFMGSCFAKLVAKIAFLGLGYSFYNKQSKIDSVTVSLAGVGVISAVGWHFLRSKHNALKKNQGIDNIINDIKLMRDK